MKENSIEEDIILLKDFTEGNFKRDKLEHYKGSYKMGYFYYKDIQQAIEHILSDYKRVLKENEELLEVKVSASAHNRILELEKENEELREKWDKDTHILQNELDLTNADKINNYIPIQKVKDILEQKDKIIDLMADDIHGTQVECNRYFKDKEDVKQYFENKAKELLNK